MKQGIPFRITKAVLERAWRWKCRGLKDAEIAKKLHIAFETYSRHKIKFLIFYARKKRLLDKRERGRPSSFEQNRDACVKLAGLGFSGNQIAQIISVAESTIRNWRDLDATFDAEMTAAAGANDGVVMQSLLKRAMGYNLPKVKDKIIYGIGNVVIGRETTREIEHYPPNVAAIINWLTNRLAHWNTEKKEAVTTDDTKEVLYDIRDTLYRENNLSNKGE